MSQSVEVIELYKHTLVEEKETNGKRESRDLPFVPLFFSLNDILKELRVRGPRRKLNIKT